MELKKEDFIRIRWKGIDCYALRPDYFGEPEPITVKEQIKEAFEKKIEIEIVEIPGPTEEELAEIAKNKLIEEKKTELAKLLGD